MRRTDHLLTIAALVMALIVAWQLIPVIAGILRVGWAP